MWWGAGTENGQMPTDHCRFNSTISVHNMQDDCIKPGSNMYPTSSWKTHDRLSHSGRENLGIKPVSKNKTRQTNKPACDSMPCRKAALSFEGTEIEGKALL